MNFIKPIGKIKRKEYIITQITTTLLALIFVFTFSLFGFIVTFFLIYLNIVSISKRLQDIGMSGWIALAYFTPLNIPLVIWLAFVKSK